MAQGKERIDWEAIEQTPEFQELVTKRRSFVLPATIFFLTYYMAFILMAGYAEDFMGSSVYEGLTVGYVYALTQFLMVFTLGWVYLKRSERVYDPLSEKAIARYVDEEDVDLDAALRNEEQADAADAGASAPGDKA